MKKTFLALTLLATLSAHASYMPKKYYNQKFSIKLVHISSKNPKDESQHYNISNTEFLKIMSLRQHGIEKIILKKLQFSDYVELDFEGNLQVYLACKKINFLIKKAGAFKHPHKHQVLTNN